MKDSHDITPGKRGIAVLDSSADCADIYLDSHAGHILLLEFENVAHLLSQTSGELLQHFQRQVNDDLADEVSRWSTSEIHVVKSCWVARGLLLIGITQRLADAEFKEKVNRLVHELGRPRTFEDATAHHGSGELSLSRIKVLFGTVTEPKLVPQHELSKILINQIQTQKLKSFRGAMVQTDRQISARWTPASEVHPSPANNQASQGETSVTRHQETTRQALRGHFKKRDLDLRVQPTVNPMTKAWESLAIKTAAIKGTLHKNKAATTSVLKDICDQLDMTWEMEAAVLDQTLHEMQALESAHANTGTSQLLPIKVPVSLESALNWTYFANDLEGILEQYETSLTSRLILMLKSLDDTDTELTPARAKRLSEWMTALYEKYGIAVTAHVCDLDSFNPEGLHKWLPIIGLEFSDYSAKPTLHSVVRSLMIDQKGQNSSLPFTLDTSFSDAALKIAIENGVEFIEEELNGEPYGLQLKTALPLAPRSLVNEQQTQIIDARNRFHKKRDVTNGHRPRQLTIGTDMADDQDKNRDQDKQKPENGDLFSAMMNGGASDSDDHADLPDDLIFGGASAEEVNSNATPPPSTPETANAAKPQLSSVKSTGQKPTDSAAGTSKAGDSNVIRFRDISDRESTATSISAEGNPEGPKPVSPQTMLKAAAFRDQAAAMPVIRGWDAGLVAYDPKSRSLVPASEEAAQELLKKGGDANINVLYPGQSQWTPVKLDADEKTGNLVIKRNDGEDLQDYKAMNRIPKGDGFRLSPTTSPMQKIKLSPENSDELSKALEESHKGNPGARGMDDDDEKDKKDKNSNQDPFNSPPSGGAMLAAGVGKALSGLWDWLKAEWSKFKAFASRVFGSMKDFATSKTHNRSAQSIQSLPTLAKTAAASVMGGKAAKAAVGSSGADGVSQQLKAKIDQTVTQLESSSAVAFNRYEKAQQESSSQLHEGLGTNEAGAAMIRSGDQFMERYGQRSEHDQSKVQLGVEGLENANRDLSKSVSRLSDDPRLDTLPAEKQQRFFEHLNGRMNDKPKLNALEAAAMQHAVNPANPDKGSLQENIAKEMQPAREQLAERMQEANASVLEKSLAQQNQAMRESAAEQAHRTASEMAPRPT